MKKLNKKSLALLIAAALLLTIAVSGTVAYLVDSTGSLVNTFTPTTVNGEIDETFTDNVKSEIVIQNPKTDKSISVYVRVAVVGNWYKGNEITAAWTPEFTLGADWQKIGDFYYYKYVVNPGNATSDLLGSSISGTNADRPGEHLEVTVIQQSIQATPKDAVQEAWGTNVANWLANTTKAGT